MFNHSKFYITLVGLLTLGYALLIFSYPPSFYNDDSLFLTNGIIEFSVIDFSPHFPGYASLILLGKFLNIFLEDAKLSLFILTATCSVFLPFILFLYVRKVLDEKIAFFAFVLSISSPYLMNLSLSMMSDSVGLFFFFLGLYVLELNKNKTAGIILAISFFARPSYIILFIAGIVFLWFYKRENFKPVLLSFLLTALVFLFYIFATNGTLFIVEGFRFLEGHFTLWGTGQNAKISWFSQIFSLENIPFLFLFFIKLDKKLKLLCILFISYLVWMLFAQNPDSLRHIIPLIILANIFLAKILKNQKIIIFLIVVFNVFIIQSYSAKYSPIDQIISELKITNKLIISNRSIEILRDNLDAKVFDAYYSDSSSYYALHVESCLISTINPNIKEYEKFKPRFIGENIFYLNCTK